MLLIGHTSQLQLDSEGACLLSRVWRDGLALLEAQHNQQGRPYCVLQVVQLPEIDRNHALSEWIQRLPVWQDERGPALECSCRASYPATTYDKDQVVYINI